MKKLLTSFVAVLLVLAVAPTVIADTPQTGGGVGVGWDWDVMAPHVYMDADTRVVFHNAANGNNELVERVNNYAFEGEQIQWDVLVHHCEGINKVFDVYGAVALDDLPDDPEDYDMEVNCVESERTDPPAAIGEEACQECCQNPNQFDPTTMGWYTCTLTVEQPISMYGEHGIAVVAFDMDEDYGMTDEQEFWFLNPEIALEISDDFDFGTVYPGGVFVSNTVLIESEVDDDSGVLLDMAVSGTDFYDVEHSGAMCPTSNVLNLNSGGNRAQQLRCHVNQQGPGEDPFCYYASNGNYDTANDAARADAAGYVGIPYETSDPDDRAPIISSTDPTDIISYGGVDYFAGNVLGEGGEIAFNLRMSLPTPCYGQFDSGMIYFWGTAI